MSLVNGPQDPALVDHSTNDPSNAAFDHRFEADGPSIPADAIRTGATAKRPEAGDPIRWTRGSRITYLRILSIVDSTCIIIKKTAALETPWNSLIQTWVSDALTYLISVVNKELWTNIRDRLNDEISDTRQKTCVVFEADPSGQKQEAT